MRALTAQEIHTHGPDAQIDPRTNEVIPRGIGSAGHETTQHYAALEKARAKIPARDGIPSVSSLDEMLSLFEASTDLKKHSDRVRKLQEVASIARTEVANAARAKDEIASMRVRQLEQMATEKGKLESVLESERAKFEQDRAAKFAELNQREAELSQREAELRQALALHSDRTAELDKKLSLIREAAR